MGGGGRGRAGTEAADYGGDNKAAGHAAMLDDAFGDSAGVFGAGGTTFATIAAPSAASALLAEVGGTIAATNAIASSGVLSVTGITSVDMNLAALPLRVQQSLIRAVKSLTKDVLVDLLLHDVRVRMDAAAKAAAEREAAGISEEEEAAAEEAEGAGDEGGKAAAAPPPLGGGEEGSETAARRLRASTSGSGAGSKQPAHPAKETAAAEYQRRRTEMRERPFADLCSSVPADDIPQALMHVAAAFAEVMHTHFLVLQWHRTPLDPRTTLPECEFMHMAALDEESPAAVPGEGGEDEDAERQYRAAALKAAATRIPRGTGITSSPALDSARFLAVLQVCAQSNYGKVQL